MQESGSWEIFRENVLTHITKFHVTCLQMGSLFLSKHLILACSIPSFLMQTLSKHGYIHYDLYSISGLLTQ